MIQIRACFNPNRVGHANRRLNFDKGKGEKGGRVEREKEGGMTRVLMIGG